MRYSKKKRVIVTAGGTIENIDSVRSITNHATGKLGSLISDYFTDRDWEVTYISGSAIFFPEKKPFNIIKIKSVDEFAKNLKKILRTEYYDCVIHSMAVSDFTPCSVTTSEQIATAVQAELKKNINPELMTERICNIILNGMGKPINVKINSNSEDIVLVMTQTPKVIRIIKELQPKTLLVGFKLLYNASEDELFKAGLKQIDKAGCNYVLANDITEIEGDLHKAFLMDRGNIIHRAENKKEIAKIIYETISERIKTDSGNNNFRS